MLDTLQTVKRLKEAGFSETQAEAVTNVLREEQTSNLASLATRDDLAALRADLQREMAALRSELRAEMAMLRQQFDARIDGLEAKFAARLEGVEAKMEILRRDLTIRLGSMLVVVTGILLAAKFFG